MSHLKKSGFISATIFLMFFIACGDESSPDNPPPTPAVSISISPTTANLTVGESRSFTVTQLNTDFSLSAPTAAGCVKSGNTVTCTPNAAGTYIVTVTATADTTKSNTATLTAIDDEPKIHALDISEISDWNYMVFANDGSSIFFSVDKDSERPDRIYYKPEKNSDTDFAFLLKENGLPDKMIFENHIFYFGNFRGTKFDMALIHPDNTIKYFYDVETGVDWDDFIRNDYIATQSLGDAIDTFNRAWKSANTIIDVGTCHLASVLPPPANMLALKECATFAANQFIHTLVDEVITVGDYMSFSHIANDFAHILVDVSFCLGLADVLECITATGNGVDLLYRLAFELDSSVKELINEVIRMIDGDALTIIPPDLFENFLDLRIEINNGTNPPDIEGTYLVSTLQLVRNTTGIDIATQRNKYVTFSKQDNTTLTINVEYTMQVDDLGTTSLTGTGSFIVGEGNKFTVVVDGTREYGGFTAKTVEVFSGEIYNTGISTGIRNYQWAVMMIDDRGDPLDVWISNGTGYSKRDSDGFSVRISSP